MTPQFSRSKEQAVDELYRGLSERGTPIRYVWSGDRLIGGDTTLTVLQPDAHKRYRSDNAASMVLELSWRGRHFLMTGDLEGDGLGQMLGEPVRRRDVFVAPHHGSRLSNNRHVAHWACSQLVISSQGRRSHTHDPVMTYVEAGSLALRTDREGGISLRCLPDGLEVRSFRTGRRFLLP